MMRVSNPRDGQDERDDHPTRPDPFSTPTIFLRIGWMTRYQGQATSDHITGGGAFVEEHGYGHEIFNFQLFEGRVFGYVQPPGSGHNLPQGPGININRLGAARTDDSILGVLAVWVATSPQGGSYIVGWYSNATVQRHRKRIAVMPIRNSDTTLPPPMTIRSSYHQVSVCFQCRAAKVAWGQANVWYADNLEQHRQIRTSSQRDNCQDRLPVLVSAHPDKPIHSCTKKLNAPQSQLPRPTIRKLGYEVDSVESDNVGWDLNAVHGQRQLKLEVKGLSSSQLRVELTPNKYDKMKAPRESYRVCVVTDALSSPELAVFAFSQETQRWEDQDGRILQIDEIVAARCSIG
jgi:hypothetical protein